MSNSYVGMLHCARCGTAIGVLLDRRLKETFKTSQAYSTGELCDQCKELAQVEQEAFKDGGFAFRCTECGMVGVIGMTENSKPLCIALRQKAFGEDDPEWMTKPIGLEYVTCQEHDDMGLHTPEKERV